jgi:nucleoside-diphosphate-sugar epimerase
MHERKPRVLVTGGAGYLGSTLVPQLLADGFSVRVLDTLRYGGRSLLGVWSHPGFQFLRGDVRDRAMVRASLEDIDAVVHLAAIVGDPACGRDPEFSNAVNIEGTQALVADAKDAGVKRLVFASTCSNYGRMADPNVPIAEDGVLAPVSLYAEQKVAMEQMLLNGASEGIAVTCLRFATVYGVGPRMRFDLTVNEFARDLWADKDLEVFGEQFWRPYVHVRDAARAVRTALEAPVETVRGEVFNVGRSGENYRKLDLVEVIQSQVNRGRVSYVKRTEDPRDYKVSFDKVRDVLGFETTMTVPDGVAEVIAALDANSFEDPYDGRYRNIP